MTDKSQPLSGAAPAPQSLGQTCVCCGDIRPNPLPANWSSYCKSEKNNFATDTAGNKLHTYYSLAAAPVAVPAEPRQKVEPSQGWSIRLGIDDTWEGHAPYWFFDVLKGNSIEGCGSADDLPTALSMAAELYGDIVK